VLGCLIPLPICMLALPGVPPSLAHSAATKQLDLLAEACTAHHYAMVCAFVAEDASERSRMASMGRALGSGLTAQKCAVKECMGPAAWEARLWWLLFRTVLLPVKYLRRSVTAPPPQKKLKELEHRLAAMERIIVSSQGLEFALDGMIAQPPPRALMQVSGANREAVSGVPSWACG
jgi:hypothetical protein